MRGAGSGSRGPPSFHSAANHRRQSWPARFWQAGGPASYCAHDCAFLAPLHECCGFAEMHSARPVEQTEGPLDPERDAETAEKRVRRRSEPSPSRGSSRRHFWAAPCVGWGRRKTGYVAVRCNLTWCPRRCVTRWHPLQGGRSNMLLRHHRHPSRHHMLTSQRPRAVLKLLLIRVSPPARSQRTPGVASRPDATRGHPLQPAPLRAWLVNVTSVFWVGSACVVLAGTRPTPGELTLCQGSMARHFPET